MKDVFVIERHDGFGRNSVIGVAPGLSQGKCLANDNAAERLIWANQVPEEGDEHRGVRQNGRAPFYTVKSFKMYGG